MDIITAVIFVTIVEMKNNILLLGSLVIIVTGIFLLSDRNDLPEAENDLDQVFSLTFSDMEGNIVSLKDYLGTPLVVNSWASWCNECKEELPDFGRLQEEYGSEIVVIAINREESRETSLKFSNEFGVTEKIVFWLDDEDAFYRTIQGLGMPNTIFIDREGRIVEKKRGIMDLDEMMRKTESIVSS